MTDLVRQEIMTAADLVVVKVGTRVLVCEDGTLDDQRVASIAEQILRIRNGDERRVVLVSSGAVGAGTKRGERRPVDIVGLQAAAAIGQSLLIQSYCGAMKPLIGAQVLLTADDLQDRSRYLNVRNTLFALFERGAVPIINENDTVSVDELQISFGDNDRLAALVTNLIRAPLLVLLSDVDGLFDGDPNDDASSILSVVTDVAAAQKKLVYDRALGDASVSRGGMASKLQAARIVTSAGENVVIANGRRDNVLEEILSGADIGTLILAEGPSIGSRKRWIGWSAQPAGKLNLDEGACSAIKNKGSSLLAVGVARVEGRFAKGDVVALCNEAGVEFARGLTNYTSDEMQKIAGQPKERVAELLDHRPYDEVIHRDNLVVLG